MKIINLLLKEHLINQDDIEIYKYSLFVISFNFICIFSLIFWGCLFNLLNFTLLFILYYLPIRIYIGGFHCKTPLKCFLLFNSSYIVILISYFFLNSYFNQKYALIISLILFFTYFLLKSKSDKSKFLFIIIIIELLFLNLFPNSLDSYCYATTLNIILFIIPHIEIDLLHNNSA